MANHAEDSSRTLTYLFTDIEDSTRLWEQHPQAMKAALERHDAILRAAVEGSNGQVVKSTGDGILAVFHSTLDGLRASLQAQRSLRVEPWGETGPLRVRMGLHAGESQPRGGDYYGPVVNRAARLMSASHGGQVLLSAAAASLVIDLLPEGMELRDLGEHRLKSLERPEHIFQLVHPDLEASFPPLATLSSRPNNLPALPTPLIGREAELGQVVDRLNSEKVRLLTLTGTGGIGKTRLAIQAAAELLDRFEDGVFFVDLAPIRDPEAVPAAIAQTLGLRSISDRPLLDELKEQLRPKRLLLLLDNFEQVTAAAQTVVELMRDCPHLKLLVTSREALNVRGEYILPVPPLALPKEDQKGLAVEHLIRYEAVELFVERAQAVKPGFQVTEENAAVIAEIVQRLDGLPLAIELAAARTKLFSPQALLERLGSRLSLLRGGSRDLPARQQALRSTIDWSYQLLDAGEKRLFELLSVFLGCTVEAAEGVAGEIELLNDLQVDLVDALASLVDKSLVRQVDPGTGEPRLLMLGTIREYAAERLEQDPELNAAAHRAHAVFFAGFTQRQWERLTGSGREAALQELVSDVENVRAAWRYWVRERDLEQLGKFVDSLWLLYDVRGWYHATVELTNDLLQVLPSAPSTPELAEEKILLQTSLARALLAIKGYLPEVEEAYTRALELSQAVGEIPQLFPVLRGLSSYYLSRAEFEKAARMGEQILALAERYEDVNLRIEGHFVLGANLAFIHPIEQGLDHLEKGIADIGSARPRSGRFRLGNDPGVACLTTSALILFWLGFPDRAVQRTTDAVDLAKRLNHPYSTAYALFHAGYLHLWRREEEISQRCAQEVQEIAEEHEFQVWGAVATCLHGAALARKGRPEEGLVQVRQGATLYQGLKTPPIFWQLLLYTQAETCGYAGKPEQGLALLEDAMTLSNDGFVGMILGEFYRLKGELLLAISPDRPAEAEAWFQRALEIAQELGSPTLELRAAINLNRLWEGQGKVEPGQALLREAYARFTEGFTTADLSEARDLLSR